jgi:3' terminal RNA ribose 2'-O-methyltransferase Hen1
MLLTLRTTRSPATDLGYLLGKRPERVQSFALPFGQAVVFYPEVSDEACTAALLLEVDPVGLVRGRGQARSLAQYVNDRPYTASSLLSVAIAQVFRSALNGSCRDKPHLPDAALPLRAHLAVVSCGGGPGLLHRLFQPLGYTLTVTEHPLDAAHPAWGPGRYFSVTLEATTRLAALLSHLYVLIPVLDDDKHYWVGDDEVDKLLRHGGPWLPDHPERALIAQRYLKHQQSLTREALARLTARESPDDPDAHEVAHAREEGSLEKPLRLDDVRREAVVAALKESGARRVLDLGCGEGKLLRSLLAERGFDKVVGVDVSHRALEVAAERLNLQRLPPRQRDRVELLHGSLTYRDARLAGYDAAALVEVIEHLDPDRVAALERVVFEFARPKTVVLTTPNAEFNATFADLPPGRFRHRDHRFEWTRAEFVQWAHGVAERFGYTVTFAPIGAEHPAHGAPTQMAVFTLRPTGEGA